MFLKSASFSQCVMVISVELTLNGIIVLFGPRTESFQKPVLFPIYHYFFHSPLLLVIFASVLKPCVETSAILHLCHTTHVICHYFLGQILRFGLNCNTTRLDSLDLFSLINDLKVLVFNMSIHVHSLFHVGHLHLSSLYILPFLESHANQVPDVSIDCSGHKLSG